MCFASCCPLLPSCSDHVFPPEETFHKRQALRYAITDDLPDAEGATADYGYLKILWETARLCPRCSVVIQRSKGCDHVQTAHF